MRTEVSTCVCSIPARALARGLGRALACAAITACTASAEDVRPPATQLFFPSGLAVAPADSGNVLFVANSNSELRYDSGAISVIDLTVVDSVINAWVTNREKGPCEEDPAHRETLVCDETMFIKPGAGVRIGNFATDIDLQDFSTHTADGTVVKLRVLVPTRGDPSVAWADYDGDRLSCAPGSTGFAVCDSAHRLSSVHNDPDESPITDEPFGVFATTQPADPEACATQGLCTQRGFAMVTHMTAGALTLIDAPESTAGEVANVQITDAVFNIFGVDPLTGLRSATGVAGRRPGTGDEIVYVGSRGENRIQTFTIGRPVNSSAPYLLNSGSFFLNQVGNSAGVGNSLDSRGMKFSSTGDRLYVVNRRPPTLQIIDTSLGPTGVPRNVLVGASDICRQASNVAVLATEDAGERAYVTCFQDGELYVIDPRGQSQVEDILIVGRGPYSIAASKDQQRLFVSNFLEDTIAVIDVKQDSVYRNRVVLRIGQPKAP